jgi:hypothetical protein
VKFVVVLTFLSGVAGQPQELIAHCPTAICAEQIMEHANESRRLSRLRVWDEDEYTPLSLGGAVLWPPFVDRWYQ